MKSLNVGPLSVATRGGGAGNGTSAFDPGDADANHTLIDATTAMTMVARGNGCFPGPP